MAETNPDLAPSGEYPVVDGELAPNKIIAGKYVVDHLLGEGGMGTVWSAYHQQTNRPVAIKALRVFGGKGPTELARQRMLREARAAGSIRHPNVIDVYDVLDSTEGPLLVMELLEGESLQELMGRGKLPPEDVFRVLIPAMRGVAAAHERGIVHRDLKPDNIFLSRNARGALLGVKVLDFGISKVAEDPTDNTLTRSGTILGTPAYMAPEQLTAAPIDPRTDVYALGAIAYEALTGQLPHEGETFALMASAKLGKDPTGLRKLNRDIPRALEKVIQRALAREREDRYQNVAEFAWACEPFTDVGFGAASIQLSSETGRHATRSNDRDVKTWVAIAIAGLLVAAATVAASTWLLSGDTVAESETETASESESESESESVAETETASESESVTETESESGSETASETETATASESASETETETASESASESETASGSSRIRPRQGMRLGMGRSGTLSASEF